MARKSSNDKSQIRNALEAFKNKGTLTPSELCSVAGVDLKYASKFASWLRHYGHDITTNKSGKAVVSYTYVGATTNVRELPASAPRQAKPKASVKKAPVAKAAMSEEDIKKAAVALQKLRAQKQDSAKATSYSIDPDWDAVDDVKALL